MSEQDFKPMGQGADKDNKPMGLKDKLLVLGVFLLIGGVFGFIALKGFGSIFAQARAHKTYEAVEAVVTKTPRIKTNRSQGSSKRATYEPVITYRYSVAGQDYTSKRYSYTFTMDHDYGDAKRIVEAHPKGTVVTAYFDPDDPSQAVLDNTKASPIMFYLFMAFFLGVFGYIVKVGFLDGKGDDADQSGASGATTA